MQELADSARTPGSDESENLGDTCSFGLLRGAAPPERAARGEGGAGRITAHAAISGSY